MKASELRSKDLAGLEKEVADLLKAHFGLRMQMATQQMSNTAPEARPAATSLVSRPVLAEKKKGAQMTQAQAAEKNTRTLVGRVVCDKRDKTVTVLVERHVKHPLYGKIVATSNKYHAHDEKGQYHLGDLVEIAEGRPISKTKAWVVTRLIEKARVV